MTTSKQSWQHELVTEFDASRVLAAVGGDHDLLTEIVRLLMADLPGLMRAVRERLHAGDAAGLERATHGLRGAVSNVGAPGTVKAALAIEHSARAGMLDQAFSHLAELEARAESLRASLESHAAHAVAA